MTNVTSSVITITVPHANPLPRTNFRYPHPDCEGSKTVYEGDIVYVKANVAQKDPNGFSTFNGNDTSDEVRVIGVSKGRHAQKSGQRVQSGDNSIAVSLFGLATIRNGEYSVRSGDTIYALPPNPKAEPYFIPTLNQSGGRYVGQLVPGSKARQMLYTRMINSEQNNHQSLNPIEAKTAKTSKKLYDSLLMVFLCGASLAFEGSDNRDEKLIQLAKDLGLLPSVDPKKRNEAISSIQGKKSLMSTNLGSTAQNLISKQKSVVEELFSVYSHFDSTLNSCKLGEAISGADPHGRMDVFINK